MKRKNPVAPVAIVQARMGSTRLPGKVLKPLAGRPALWHLIDRLKHSKRLYDIVIATTVNRADEAIVEFCRENNVKWYRGSEKDCLDRWLSAAQHYGMDPIIGVTADCPAIDPVILDEVIREYFEKGYDLCGHGGEFPDGLDCGCFAYWVLEDAWKHARLPSEREHVGVYMGKHPEKYKMGSYERFTGLAHHRWTLDEEADYRFLQEIFGRLYKPGEIFLAQDVLELLRKEPRLMEINAGITRNEGYLKSLAEDEEYLKKR